MVLERRAGPAPFEASELLAELPRGMAERVSRRLASAGDAELRRAGEEWFARRTERLARTERLGWIARLRAAEHRKDAADVATALKALSRGPEPGGDALHEADDPLDADHDAEEA
jgi:hypothetical protein